MAGKAGGGAWKVAYADFVTAMMAFFLVMWLCAQNQDVKKSVANYFSDPLGTTHGGTEKKTSRTGSVNDAFSTGAVPLQESVALGNGRGTYSATRFSNPATKLVRDWLVLDKETHLYWQKQAADHVETARLSSPVKQKKTSVNEFAVRRLSAQLKEELVGAVPIKSGLNRDLLLDAYNEVNWIELAEDLIGS